MHTRVAGAHPGREAPSIHLASRPLSWLVIAAVVAVLVSGCGVGRSLGVQPAGDGRTRRRGAACRRGRRPRRSPSAGGHATVPRVPTGRARHQPARPARRHAARRVRRRAAGRVDLRVGRRGRSPRLRRRLPRRRAPRRGTSTAAAAAARPADEHIDDVAFITRVVATVRAELPIDPARVYATGISNGGILSYRLACDTRLFAAIGPDSATLLGTCTDPSPVSVIHIHGTADTRIPYNGGMGTGAGHIDGPPVPTVIATWRQVDGCAAPAHHDGRRGDHVDRHVPGRSLGRAHHHRRRRTPVAGQQAEEQAGRRPARQRPTVHRPRRHRHDLDLLRRPPPAMTVGRGVGRLVGRLVRRRQIDAQGFSMVK